MDSRDLGCYGKQLSSGSSQEGTLWTMRLFVNRTGAEETEQDHAFEQPSLDLLT